MDATNNKQSAESSNDMDTATSVRGQRARTVGGTVETGSAEDGNNGKRPGSEGLEIALAVGVEVVKGHAQWRNPDVRSQGAAHQFPVLGDVGGAVSAWVADEVHRVLGWELSPDEKARHAELAQATKTTELDAWEKFEVCEPRKNDGVSKQILQSR